MASPVYYLKPASADTETPNIEEAAASYAAISAFCFSRSNVSFKVALMYNTYFPPSVIF